MRRCSCCRCWNNFEFTIHFTVLLLSFHYGIVIVFTSLFRLWRRFHCGRRRRRRGGDDTSEILFIFENLTHDVVFERSRCCRCAVNVIHVTDHIEAMRLFGTTPSGASERFARRAETNLPHSSFTIWSWWWWNAAKSSVIIRRIPESRQRDGPWQFLPTRFFLFSTPRSVSAHEASIVVDQFIVKLTQPLVHTVGCFLQKKRKSKKKKVRISFLFFQLFDDLKRLFQELVSHLGDEFALFVKAQVALPAGRVDPHFTVKTSRNKANFSCKKKKKIIFLLSWITTLWSRKNLRLN